MGQLNFFKIIFSKLIFLFSVFIFINCGEGLSILLTENNNIIENFWELEVTTTAPGQNMTIGLISPVNINILWGDGLEDTTNLTSITHVYASAGVYILKIRGQASRVRFDNADAQARLTGILSVFKGIEGITSFAASFTNCINITGSLSTGLFDYTTQVTTFLDTFKGCSGLTGTIPSGLFDNNTQVTTFQGVFLGCTGLTGAIPDGLFDNNILVTNFSHVFENCTGLTSIPFDIFFYNTAITNVGAAFANDTAITGNVPELWNLPYNSLPFNITTYGNCFFNMPVTVTNQASIPVGWK